MLRITIDEGEESVVLRLEGKLIAPWVAEVEQRWQRAFTSVGERSVQGRSERCEFRGQCR